MGERRASVYVIVGFLSIAAAALAFAGEATRVKKSDLAKTTFGCNIPRTWDNVFGYIALTATFTAQGFLSSVADCGSWDRNPASEIQANAREISCFIISWVATLVAASLLYYAANTSKDHQSLKGTAWCYNVLVPPGIFAVAGIFVLIACALGLYSYNESINKYKTGAAKTSISSNQDGIVIGNDHIDSSTTNSSYPMNPKQQVV